ncbi:MAG: N-acetylmuramoyl-L-alanine amidase [Hyphomicrobiaceae bacterium]|nr:N-acetylmuramoyl-L-alanine amidase [Hyphomicrobiaceae bacterium]
MNSRKARTTPAGRWEPRASAIAAALLIAAGVMPCFPSAAGAASTTPNAAAELAPTRFVVALESAVEFEVLSLSNPNRVIVELPEVRMRLPAVADDSATGLVKSFRGGLSAPGRSRIVIEVRAPVIVERSAIEKTGRSHRLVLDLVPAASGKPPSQAQAQTQAKASQLRVQPPLPRPAMRPEEIAAKAYKPVIVIDPGHGGDDSGAIKNGIVEKDAVLAFSLALRDKLDASGLYRVVMTRDADLFISLDERRAIAERNKAALFIAVHADYAGSHARGATIYSLTDSTANALQRSASRDVVKSVLTGSELAAVHSIAGDEGDIKAMLADLAQYEVAGTKERTSTFAREVIEFMSASTSMRENADREANFLVLKTAKVPSVLIELAYVTNAQDAQNLKSAKWRDKVSDSIATAIVNYFSKPIARAPM